MKAPYDTGYYVPKAVLEDPEGHVFRLNCCKRPRRLADEIDTPPWQK